MITKDEAKNYALKIKQETGEFPVLSKWIKKNGFPCGVNSLLKLFDGSYNNFRDYCAEPHLIRTQNLTLDWLKSNCVIDENQCWNWNKHLDHDNYGTLTVNNKHTKSHIASYKLLYGNIDSELLVRHK